jgi:hypothetical protein
MARIPRSSRIALAAALTLVLVLAVATFAGAAPPPGKGKPASPGNSAAAAGQQYSPPGKQYGKTKVTLCHKGKTIRVGAPAAKAHLRHGDKLGPC